MKRSRSVTKSANKGGLCKKQPSTVTHLFRFLSLYFQGYQETSRAMCKYSTCWIWLRPTSPSHSFRRTFVPQCVFETQRTDYRFWPMHSAFSCCECGVSALLLLCILIYPLKWNCASSVRKKLSKIWTHSGEITLLTIREMKQGSGLVLNDSANVWSVHCCGGRGRQILKFLFQYLYICELWVVSYTVCPTASSLRHVLVCSLATFFVTQLTARRNAVERLVAVPMVESSWNMMAHGEAREGKWRGNWRVEWVAITLYITSEHGVSSNTIADAHTWAASSWLKWRPCRFKWTRPLCRKTKSGFCACAITFQTQCTADVG
jgi:hypothetical protein